MNIDPPMAEIGSGTVAVVREVHPLKTYVPIEVTFSGMVMDTSEVQLQNAPSSIDFTELNPVIDLSEVQL